jgi:probable rRNA maturation factor
MAITLRAPRGLTRLGIPLRTLVRSTLAGEGRRPGEIGIVLARDEELRALNRSWRGIDRATDVLSFEYDGGPRVSGDLVISLDRVAAQARRYRVTRGRELARLAVHGTLHLAGFDHRRALERRGMRRREARALGAAANAVRALDRLLAAETWA